MRSSFIWRSTTARTTAVMPSTPPSRSYREPSTVPPPLLAPPRSDDVPTSHTPNPHGTSSNRVVRRHLHPPATAGPRGQHAAPPAVSCEANVSISSDTTAQTGLDSRTGFHRRPRDVIWLSSWTTESPRRCHSIRSGGLPAWRLETDPPTITAEFRRGTRSMHLVHRAAR